MYGHGLASAGLLLDCCERGGFFLPQVADCILVHVMGSIQQEASRHSSQQPAAGTKFTESFILTPSPSGNYYIANQTFRLMP